MIKYFYHTLASPSRAARFLADSALPVALEGPNKRTPEERPRLADILRSWFASVSGTSKRHKGGVGISANYEENHRVAIPKYFSCSTDAAVEYSKTIGAADKRE